MKMNSSIFAMDEITFIDSKSNSELSEIRQPFKTIFGLVIAASFIWGSLGKVFIYKNCLNFKMSERPINVLILTDEVVHHSLMAFRYYSNKISSALLRTLKNQLLEQQLPDFPQQF